jgi:aldehyde dehydrogenase (NAD+)
VELIKRRLDAFYGVNPLESESYMRLINDRNFLRVKSYLDDAISRGARVVHGGGVNARERFIQPTVLIDVPVDSTLMQNEIFGPVFPVIAYDKLQDAIDFIRSGHKPLGLYIFSKNKNTIRQVLQSTRAGGSCINHSAVHFFNANLPFGGSNNSGIGKTHGIHGFKSFSDERAVYKQILPSVLDILTPPYTAAKMKLIDLTIKWF